MRASLAYPWLMYGSVRGMQKGNIHHIQRGIRLRSRLRLLELGRQLVDCLSHHRQSRMCMG